MAAQILAICIFVGMFLLIILDKFERYYITLGQRCVGPGAGVRRLHVHSFRAIWAR